MSDRYVTRTNNHTASAGYVPLRMSSNFPGLITTTAPGSSLNEDDFLLNNSIGKQQGTYRRPYSPLIGNERRRSQIDDLSYYPPINARYLDDSCGYLPLPTQRQISGDYVTSPHYRCVNPGTTWSCNFNPVPRSIRFQDKQTQTYGPFNNFYSFQPKMDRSASFHPEYLGYDIKQTQYPSIPRNYPMNSYPHVSLPYYTENIDFKSQYLNSNLNLPTPLLGKRVVRNAADRYDSRPNFELLNPQSCNINECNTIARRSIQMDHEVNSTLNYHQYYSPNSTSYIDMIDSDKVQNNFAMRLPAPPHYSTQPTFIRRSYPYAGTIERGTDVNIDQIPFDSNTEPIVRSPRIQQYNAQPQIDAFSEDINTRGSWLQYRTPVPKYSTRNEKNFDIPATSPLDMNVQPPNFITEGLEDTFLDSQRTYASSCLSESLDKLSKTYSLQKTSSPTELERNYIKRQLLPRPLNRSGSIPVGNRSSPTTLPPTMNRTMSASQNLNRPRPANRRPRSPVPIERKREDVFEKDNLDTNIDAVTEQNENVSVQPRRASNVDISSFVTNNESPEPRVCKSFSDSSIDMTDDSSYLPLPSKKSQGTNLKQFRPLPKLHEAPAGDADYDPVKECDYYEENTQLDNIPKNSTDENVNPLNIPQSSLSQQGNSPEWEDVWDPNSVFTATEMEASPGDVEQWQINELDKEEDEELENLAETIIENMTQNKEINPVYNGPADLQDASSSRVVDQSIRNENDCQRKEKVDSAAQMGLELKTKGVQVMGSKMKFLRGKSNRRRALEDMYNSITEDILY